MPLLTGEKESADGIKKETPRLLEEDSTAYGDDEEETV